MSTSNISPAPKNKIERRKFKHYNDNNNNNSNNNKKEEAGNKSGRKRGEKEKDRKKNPKERMACEPREKGWGRHRTA